MIGEDTGTVETESFADLLDAHSQAAERFRQGMRVKCVIVAITTDTIFVSTGDKVDGIVERKEFEDADGNLSCVVGDELELYVTVATPHEVRLSKAFSSGGGVSVLKEALESGVPVEGKVMATVKGGYSVEVMKRRAFCPFSQIDSRPVETPDAMLGQTFLFLVTKVEQEGRNVIVSRRALLERENAASRESFLATVNTGDIIEAEVVRLAPFGAFVELHPGVDGLVHISELAWSRVQQASELLTVGDKVKVKLISIANDEKSSKISLSIRQVTEDPWLNLSAHVELGQVLTGKVQRLAQFGAFVELMPGVEGLIHLSEFSYEQRVHKAQDMLTIGDQISVKIKEIDVEKKRISLSMREAAGDPWADVEERFTVGSSVQATIEKREKFGVFIKLSAGVVGLLPGSVLATAKKGIYENIAAGDTIEVVINNIDKNARKISLGIPADNVGELPIMNSGAAPADTFANKARENNKPNNNNNNNSRPNNRNDRGNERGNAPSRDNRDAKPRRDRNDGGGDKSWKEHTPKNDNFGASLGLVLQAARDKKK